MADYIGATPQNPLLGLLYGGYDYLRSPQRTQQMQGLASLIESTGIPKTIERMSYGEPLTNIGQANVPLLKPETAEAMMTVAPMAGPVARGAGRLVGSQINRAMLGEGGLLAPITPQPMFAYRPSTPLKIDPTVGTRYEREFIGGLAEKKPLKIEDYQGASTMLMPWDSSSRNYKITSISDELLPSPIITHGGQDYARDLTHIDQGVAGASGLEIAKRIRDRDAIARIENINAGGTGEILHLPVTMGTGAENFSVMPVEGLLQIADMAKLDRKLIKEFDDSVRNYTPPQSTVKTPFKKFKGIMSEEGRVQIYSGEGVNSTAGELRKAIMNRAFLKENQQRFGFNAEDLQNAIIDPSLLGVPKGYVGNTAILTNPDGMQLRPSLNRTYNTDFTGQYQGTLGQSVPAEVLFPKLFPQLTKEFANKKSDIRNMALGALEKRKEGVSELIDQQVIDNYYKYVADQRAKGLLD
jgi:hypothetical protein